MQHWTTSVVLAVSHSCATFAGEPVRRRVATLCQRLTLRGGGVAERREREAEAPFQQLRPVPPENSLTRVDAQL